MDPQIRDEYNIDFVITKATIGKDGVRRWTATVSKFAADEQHDEVTPEFFKSAIEKIDNGEYPSPSLVISHYDDFRPEVKLQPVPERFKAGDTLAIYVDGSKPKAKGTFLDTPLGKAAFEAARKDIENNVPYDKRARISMAFRPDEGGVFKSESGISRYEKGSIRHFAMTRVPIVPEASFDEVYVEKSSGKTSRFQDAESIVGGELALELDIAYSSLLKSKSDSVSDLREKSDADTSNASQETEEVQTPTMVAESEDSTAVEEVAEKSEVVSASEEDLTKHEAPVNEEIEKAAVMKKEEDGLHPSSHYLVVENPKESSTWHLRVKNADGKVDHGLMGAAWAAIHEGFRGNKYEGPDKEAALTKLKKLYKQEKQPMPSKSETEEAVLDASPSEESSIVEKADTNPHEKIGTCISTKLKEGWERKRAIAACINMTKDKADYDDTVEYLQKMGVEFDSSDCMQEYEAQGYSQAIASSICNHQMKSAAIMILMNHAEFAELEEKAHKYLMMKPDECVKAYVADGMEEEKAKSTCNSDMADKMRNAMKKSATLDDVLDVAISDGEVQVVKSTATTEPEVVVKAEAASESEDVEVADVNTPSDSVGSEVDQLADIFKSVLGDSSLPLSTQVAVANSVLGRLGALADSKITKSVATEEPSETPVLATESTSAKVEPELLKAAVEEVVAPLMEQINILTDAVAQYSKDNAAYKSAIVSGGVRSKQLSYGASELLKKSRSEESIESDNGGALNAMQIATYTVGAGVRY